ncbi:MAG TPA: SCO family protein [Candidatus Baltobacteraceae bacterium]|nr:SCO family protein [Candidatus Baltobacteraceae bacterium]
MSERKIEWLVCGGIAATIFAIFAAFILFPARGKAPPVYGTLPDFTLIDQNNQKTTLDTLRGHVCIADVIFTRCAGQCLIMSAGMRDIQAALAPALQVKLLSFTTDPAYDTPPVLKKYGARYGAQDDRWLFLTGDKATLHRTTVEGLKLSAVEKSAAEQDSADDLFIHSTKLVLIDQQGRIRGYFDGETQESVAEAIAAARNLALR